MCKRYIAALFIGLCFILQVQSDIGFRVLPVVNWHALPLKGIIYKFSTLILFLLCSFMFFKCQKWYSNAFTLICIISEKSELTKLQESYETRESCLLPIRLEECNILSQPHFTYVLTFSFGLLGIHHCLKDICRKL